MGSVFESVQRNLAAFRKRNSKIRHLVPGWAVKQYASMNDYLGVMRKPFISVKSHSKNINVYHCTQAKCGSIWLGTLFRDPVVYKYSGLVVSLFRDKYKVSRTEPMVHIKKPFPKKRILSSFKRSYGNFINDLPKNEGDHVAFFVMRDPRDVIVSWYFSMKDTHIITPGSAMRVDVHREKLNKLSFDDGLKYAIDSYVEEGKFDVPLSWVQNVPNHENMKLVRFEDLIGDKSTETFRDLFDFMDIRVPDDEFKELMYAYSFQRLTGRKAGQEDSKSHVRSGKAGNWRKHVTPDVEKYFKDKTGTLVEDLGYEW